MPSGARFPLTLPKSWRGRLACESAGASRPAILAVLAAGRRQDSQARRPRYFVTGLGPPSSIPEKGCQPGNVAVEQQHYPAGAGPKSGRRWDRVPGLPGCADQCRMTNDGNVTGQQYSIRTEYVASATAIMQKTPPTAKVPQLQRVTTQYKSQVPQPQRFVRSTSGPHRGLSRVPPGYGHWGTGRGGRSQGSRKTEAGRRPGKRTAAKPDDYPIHRGIAVELRLEQSAAWLLPAHEPPKSDIRNTLYHSMLRMSDFGGSWAGLGRGVRFGPRWRCPGRASVPANPDFLGFPDMDGLAGTLALL
jgi:hypothetical protein